MDSKEARGYVHTAGYECKGTTRKALDIVLLDSEKLEQIKQIINDKHYSVKALEYEIKEILEQE